MISRLLAVLFMSYAAVRFVKDISVRKRDLLLLCFVFFTWVRSLVFHLNYTGTYLAILLDFIIKVLPFYFVAKNISDWNITKEAMYKGGTVCIVMMAACMFGGGYPFKDKALYSQFYGFLIARGTVIKCIDFFDRKRFRTIPLIILSLVMIIICGARTPIVCVAAVFLCEIFVSLLRYVRKKKIRMRKGTWKVLCSLCVLLILGTGFIAYSRGKQMTGIKEGERIIYIIANNAFFKSDARIQILKIAGEGIADHCLFGTGLVGDRILIAGKTGYMNEFTGSYAHNMFAELLLEFGIPVGGMIILYILIVCYKGLVRSSGSKLQIYLYLISYGIVTLLISGTILKQTEFWILLAMGYSDVPLRWGNRVDINRIKRVRQE